MTGVAGTWSTAALASLLAHFGFGFLLLIALQPIIPPQQPSPESSLSLAAHPVQRSRAQAQEAPSEKLAAAERQDQGVNTGPVPLSIAQSVQPPSVPLTASRRSESALSAAPPAPLTGLEKSPPKEELSTEPLPVENVAQILPPLADVASQPPAPIAVPPRVPALAELQAALGQISALEATTATLTPSPPAPAAPGEIKETALTEIAPTLSAQNPASTVADQAEIKSDQITAALAFQGDSSATLDPLSVALFQSFTQPGDLPADSQLLRDGLAGLLASVPCSRLQISFNPETAQLELRGHLPENALRVPVLGALQQLVGKDIALSDKMRLLPRPQCGALSGIASVGLPQSTDQITNPMLLGPDAQARVLSYRGGDRLFFDLTAPDYPAYIYVDYFDAGGNVLHLAPNTSVPLAQSEIKEALRVGAKHADDPGLQIKVAPPYGQEIAVAFAASEPLYQGLRPLSEPAAPYLDFLRHRVAAARNRSADFKGEWVYFLVETMAR